MTHAVRAASTINAFMGATAGVGLVPITTLWPTLARALADRHPPVDATGLAVDFALCFGPLLLPLLLLVTGVALRSSWLRERDADRWNRVALGGWLAVSVLGALVVFA